MFYIYFSFIILFGTSIGTSVVSRQARSYTNPLNNKSVDVYLVADTSSLNVDRMEFEYLKQVLTSIAKDLTNGNPRITILFYGTLRGVDVIYQTTGADVLDVIKTKIGQKQYTTGSPTPSTLAMALGEVGRLCTSSCRSSNIPRVTVILTSAVQPMVGPDQARLLEQAQAMTIIMVGIKNKVNKTLLSLIASEPYDTYVVEISQYLELPYIGEILSNIITYVPRFLAVGETISTSNANHDYNTVQIDISENATDSDVILILKISTSYCYYQPDECFTIYGSLSQPNPTRDNAVKAITGNNHYGDSQYHYSYYFYVPQHTKRFYLSLVINQPWYSVSYMVDTIDVATMKNNVGEMEHTAR
jgi:hypothetical protein